MNQLSIWSHRMTYVNHKGEPINPAALAHKYAKPKVMRDSPLKRTDDRGVAKVSDGFLVTGFSPEQLEHARKSHETDIELANAHNAQNPTKPVDVPPPWDEDAYMRKAKPKRLRSKPYAIASAADQCAELARKAGWKNVRVEEVMKA
jgi:hypothetical protein